MTFFHNASLSLRCRLHPVTRWATWYSSGIRSPLNSSLQTNTTSLCWRSMGPSVAGAAFQMLTLRWVYLNKDNPLNRWKHNTVTPLDMVFVRDTMHALKGEICFQSDWAAARMKSLPRTHSCLVLCGHRATAHIVLLNWAARGDLGQWCRSFTEPIGAEAWYYHHGTLLESLKSSQGKRSQIAVATYKKKKLEIWIVPRSPSNNSKQVYGLLCNLMQHMSVVCLFCLQILTMDEVSKIGKISKQWTGLLREAFTDSDNFGIQFPMDLDVKMKAVMIGACFLIVSATPNICYALTVVNQRDKENNMMTCNV